MGCRRTGSFLDLLLILGLWWSTLPNPCRFNSTIAASKIWFDLENSPSLIISILFSGENVFEDQIVFPSKQTFCSCVHPISSLSARNSPDAHSVPSSELFLSILYFLPTHLLVELRSSLLNSERSSLNSKWQKLYQFLNLTMRRILLRKWIKDFNLQSSHAKTARDILPG